jgi:hypothetical protein
MKKTRLKPYVAVDIDFASHERFRRLKDRRGSTGVWLECLAYCRAQERDGTIPKIWAEQEFTGRDVARLTDLISVGLLIDGDACNGDVTRYVPGEYIIHAYAPRNQTGRELKVKRMVTANRVRAFREKVGSRSESFPTDSAACTRYIDVCNVDVPTYTSKIYDQEQTDDKDKRAGRPGLFGLDAAAWAEGIGAGQHGWCSTPGGPGALEALAKARATHFAGLDGAELMNAIRASAEKYSSSTNGLYWRRTPQKWLVWLDSQQPSEQPKSNSNRPGRVVQSDDWTDDF